MSLIYCNGAFLDDATPTISAKDRGFQLGDGVFDTLLFADGEVHDEILHFDRLARHAALLHIPFPGSDLPTIARDLIDRNELLQARCAIRTTLTRGPHERGLLPPAECKPTLVMQAVPVPDIATLPEIHAAIAHDVRRNEFSPLSRVKAIGYGDNIAAMIEARRRGATEALLLNTQGNAACGTSSNLYIREGEALITPPLADGVLDGITRQKLIAAHGIREESIPEDRLADADALYLSNSITGIRQVRRLGARELPEQNFD